MRIALLDKVGMRTPGHVGLAYDRWAPVDGSTGKIPEERRREWLRDLAGTPVDGEYKHAFHRWEDSLKSADTQMAEIELSSRLLIGHGNPSATEVGLTLHHTWGVPMIPGSALKGLLGHYIDAVYGPEEATGMHPMDPSFPEAEQDRKPFRGVTWVGNRIEHGPGAAYRAIFGAPRARTDRRFEHAGAGEAAGLVVFHDALFVPERDGEQPFATDVLTVHQRAYYDRRGQGQVPNDYDDPNPVPFLTVRPGSKFLVAMSGLPQWTQLAMRVLRDALGEWGVGSKTTSGYGRIHAENWKQIWPIEVSDPSASPAPALEAIPDHVATSEQEPIYAPASSTLVSELRTWLTGDPSPQRDKLARLRTEWLPRLRGGTSAERREFEQLIRKAIKSRKLTDERDTLLADLGVAGGQEDPNSSRT